jgi:alanine dehydrogenase
MRIGVPKEIKTQEFRVGLTPAGVAILVARGHSVLIEQGAGIGSSIPDEAFVKAGARIVATREEVWAADMVVKVKEPIAPEFALMRKDLLLFTYLHLAAAHELGKELLARGVNGVAYETIEPSPGDLPLLTPMSAVAGRMAVQAGATSSASAAARVCCSAACPASSAAA